MFELEGKDFLLFDFGDCFKIFNFLNRLKRFVNEFNFKLSSEDKVTIELNDNLTFNQSNYQYCMLCGHKIDNTLNNNLTKFSKRFEANVSIV